jgi:hypothetical protein
MSTTRENAVRRSGNHVPHNADGTSARETLLLRVTIRQIDRTSARQVPGSTSLGFLVGFTSPELEGKAVLVPRAGVTYLLRNGSTVEVDPQHESISKFRRLEETSPLCVRSLETPGDFEVQGEVIYAHENGTFAVQAGGVVLSIRGGDVHVNAPRPGDHVAFVVHGLSLWIKPR